MWGEIFFFPLAAWQVVLFAVPSLHLHCLHANLSSAMESCFHDSCAQPCCLQVSDNHQNKQLAHMLFLAFPFLGPLSPDLVPTTGIFFYPSFFWRRTVIPANSEHPLVHQHISWWFLLSPLPFSMEMVGTPTCESLCREYTAQMLWAVDQQVPGCVSQGGSKHGLTTQNHTSLAQAEAAFCWVQWQEPQSWTE